VRYTTFLSLISVSLMITSLVVIGYPIYTFIEDAENGKFDISLRDIRIIKLENNSILLNITVYGINNGRVRITDIGVSIIYNYTTLTNDTHEGSLNVYVGDISPGDVVKKNVSVYIKGIPKKLYAKITVRMNISGYLPFKMTFETPILKSGA